MTNTERFRCLLDGGRPDRTPVIEWASWWNLTVERWLREGVPAPDPDGGLAAYFGLDPLRQFWVPTVAADCPKPAYFGAPLCEDDESYLALKKHLYREETLDALEQGITAWCEKHRGEDIPVWFTLDGFFWFPRKLLGIEGHLYAYYDKPDLIRRINDDLVAYQERALTVLYRHLSPCFMTLTEDMSYNHGPMISRELYDSFMLPYYKRIIPQIQSRGTHVLIDTDGMLEPLIPWFEDAGIEGVLPLEHMAGVDICRIRKNHPDFILVGAFDKTVMHLGEDAMCREFERILPVIRSGRYIPSVDHQTPPDVSPETYRVYVRLLKEYAAKV